MQSKRSFSVGSSDSDACSGGISVWRGCRLTAQAQRPGPQDAMIATGARWPGSLQRMVRRLDLVCHDSERSDLDTETMPDNRREVNEPTPRLNDTRLAAA